LEAQFVAKKEVQQKEIDELKQELEKKNEELHKLNRFVTNFVPNSICTNLLIHFNLYSALADLKRVNEELQVKLFLN
jgi:hypothetical protein